jgi:hypothetical protein
MAADNNVDTTGHKHVHLTEFNKPGTTVTTATYASSDSNDDILFDLKAVNGVIFLTGQLLPAAGNKELFDATLRPLTSTVQLLVNGQASSSIVGGNSGTAKFTINGPAPKGGVTFTNLSSPHISMPASVTIPEGATTVSVTFTTIADRVDHAESVANSAPLTILGMNISTFVTPSTMVGGSSATVTVTLNMPALSGGYHIDLSPSNNLNSPFSVDIPEGQDHATFTISAIHETRTARASLVYRSYNAAASRQITITPG